MKIIKHRYINSIFNQQQKKKNRNICSYGNKLFLSAKFNFGM